MPTSWNAAILAVLLIAPAPPDVAHTRAAGPSPVEPSRVERSRVEPSPVVERVVPVPGSRIEPEPTPAGYPQQQLDAIEWATSRFEAIGLELPDVEISFYPTAESCHHNDGLYELIDGRHVISICVRDGDSAHIEMFRRRTVAHELVHAWEHENLDEKDREELMALLDVEVWYSADVAWEDRGGERLAETIVWGLYDQRARPVLIDQPCHELHRDFITITGHTALGPFEDYCSPT